jgi:hypothetical protein
MAASLRASSSADSKPVSRQRHGGHDRQAIECSRRRDSWSRRSKPERHREQSSRRSPPRQIQQRTSQLQSPMSTPNSSTPSLNASLEPRSFAMERTPSGESIISDNTYEPWHNYTLTCSDEEAAGRVKSHRRRLPPHGIHERILRNLIVSGGPIDKDVLDSILTAADSVFFGGVLSGRVRWDWSDPSQQRYETELIGTTALRPAAQGGYETLIVLSDPILNNPDYDRRLILSVFLHELIHCYLFILCGFEARWKGGHTAGFHAIAGVIDKWVGHGYLRLCNMKANLNHFRSDPPARIADPRLEGLSRHNHDGCNQSPRPNMEHLEDVVVVRSNEWV